MGRSGVFRFCRNDAMISSSANFSTCSAQLASVRFVICAGFHGVYDQIAADSLLRQVRCRVVTTTSLRRFIAEVLSLVGSSCLR